MLKVVVIAGATAFLMSFAEIFKPLRKFVPFFECPLCSGFHLGYIVYFLQGGESLLDAAFCAVVSSIIGLGLLKIFDR